MSAPAGSTAGAAFTVTVTALDINGNKDTGYTGTVHFTSSDSSAVLPADYMFTRQPGGRHLHRDPENGGESDGHRHRHSDKLPHRQPSVTVTAAAASSWSSASSRRTRCRSSHHPGRHRAGLDAYGNLVSSDNTHQVTVALGTNPGGGTLGGTTTATVSGGVATFSNLSINAWSTATR